LSSDLHDGGDHGGEEAADDHWPDGDVGVGGRGHDVDADTQADQALGDAEVDDVAAELEALFALEAVAAARASLDHPEPAAEQLAGAAPRATPGHAPPQHAPERGIVHADMFDADHS